MALKNFSVELDADLREAFYHPLTTQSDRIILLDLQILRNQSRLLAHFEAASLQLSIGHPITKVQK